MRTPLLVWALMLLLGSLMPISYKASLHITNNHRFLHAAIHMAAFAALAFLSAGSAKPASHYLAAFTATALFGVFLEILEHLVYRQTLEFADMRLDAYGAALGCLALYTVKYSVVKQLWKSLSEPTLPNL